MTSLTSKAFFFNRKRLFLGICSYLKYLTKCQKCDSIIGYLEIAFNFIGSSHSFKRHDASPPNHLFKMICGYLK